jgi:hypothetical protein
MLSSSKPVPSFISLSSPPCVALSSVGSTKEEEGHETTKITHEGRQNAPPLLMRKKGLI